MREIKFRAWGATEYSDWKPEMQYSFDIISSDGEIFYGGDAMPEWVLMQYTGLKDKDGREIYEGDIVNLIPDGYIKELATVEWDDDKASWIYRRISELELVNKSGVFVNWKPIEVIGNIYENPELLDIKPLKE